MRNMISLKKYLDEPVRFDTKEVSKGKELLLPATVAAYRAALREMASCSLAVHPASGEKLKQNLDKLEEKLSSDDTVAAVEATGRKVQEQLQDWGKRTATHFQQTTDHVKEILLVMARTAESVGERDQRCAQQISDVTTQLHKIASLEDLTQIRASIKKSAAELKTSIDKMAAEGKAAVEQARMEISTYQAKLEEAEQIASRDSLTGLRSRLWVENLIDRRIDSKTPFCAAILDLDGFKQVNDAFGHLVGDELLKQFATELQSACRSSDVIGRWGGDEFIILLDCALAEAKTQTERLLAWVCGEYAVEGTSGPMKLTAAASIGLAEHLPDEMAKDLLHRADSAMYEQKAASRAARSGRKH